MSAIYTSIRMPKDTYERLEKRIEHLKKSHPESNPTKTSIINHALKKYLDELEVTM